MATGWKVLTAECSKSTNGLRITGINHETTCEIDRKFSWTINHHGLADSRYDWADCVFAAGAEDRLAQLRKLAG